MKFREYFRTEVERAWVNQLFERHPELPPLLARRSLTPRPINDYIQSKLHDREENFVVFQVHGEEGSGKSGVIQQIGLENYPGFSADDIGMKYEEFIDIYTTGKPLSLKILDEQVLAHGVGSRRIVDDIRNLKETSRANQVSLAVVSPTEKMLRISDVHLTIHVLARRKDEVLCAWLKEFPCYLGAFEMRLSWNNPVWLAYQERHKKRYLLDARSLKFRKSIYEELAEKIMQREDFAVYGAKQKTLLLLLEKEYQHLTTTEKHLVVEQIKMLKRPPEPTASNATE